MHNIENHVPARGIYEMETMARQGGEMRFLAPALAAAALLLSSAAAADSANDYTAIVTDASTGEVLHAIRADAPHKPASLTKLMTIYLLLEAVEAGEIGLGDRIRVSEFAAAQPPVDLGIEAGDTIRVLDAIKALVIRSANDVAVAVAERLGRNEARFAEMMNAKAAELGMTRTRFRNATGLPHPDDTTTARDVAILAEALMRDFPEHYALFSLSGFEWNGVRSPNQNRVLHTVEGATGLKTGYTREAGYTLAATARRDGRDVIAVIMGAPDLDSRAAFAETLFDAAFDVLASRAPAPVDGALTLVRASASGSPRGIKIIVEPVGAAGPAIDEQIDPSPTPLIEPRPTPAPTARWGVQVGAYSTAAAAEKRLNDVRAAAGQSLASAATLVAPAENSGTLIWRARFTGLDESDARSACAAVGAANAGPCFVVGGD